MPFNKKHTTAIQYLNDCSDRIAVTKTVFEWFRVVFAVAAAGIIFFSSVYRIPEICVISADNTEKFVNVLVSVYGYSPENGDNVAVMCEKKTYSATVLAQSGQYISVNTRNDEIAVDYVLSDKKLYPSAEELEKAFGRNTTVPNGCVLVKYNDNKSEKLGIVSEENIIGKINTVLYPVEYFGKSVEDIKR